MRQSWDGKWHGLRAHDRWGCIPDCQGILGQGIRVQSCPGDGRDRMVRGPGLLSEASPTGKGSAGLSLTRGGSGDVGTQPPMLSTQLKFKRRGNGLPVGGGGAVSKTACGTRTLLWPVLGDITCCLGSLPGGLKMVSSALRSTSLGACCRGIMRGEQTSTD